MAVMIPELGPQETESPGEPTVYALLRDGLSDEYFVIHSLPWLCAAVRDIDRQYAPTGEIDFLVVHPGVGVLALEVKSGHYRVEGATFIKNGPGNTKSPISQVRRNVHGLTRWLGADPGLRIRFGYGFIFPDSRFGDTINSPALADVTVDPPQRIVVDREQVPNVARRVSEMLAYWNRAGGTHALGAEKAKRLVETLCPKYDGTPSWGMRVMYDNQVWLRLTKEQADILTKASEAHRMVVTGWPGTGKTLIGSELASRSAQLCKKVLFVTFNTLLRDTLQYQLSDHAGTCDVFTWHGLCRESRKRLKLPSDSSEDWLATGCLLDLISAVKAEVMDVYDVLVLDEAQALRTEWVHALLGWFDQKQVVAFCDETQVFCFEQQRVTLGELCAAMGVTAFNLTMVLRMPKAVTERLLECRPVDYQLFSPRPLDSKSLQERAIDNWAAALTSTLDELLQQGLEGQEIVVLTRLPPDYLSSRVIDIVTKAGVRHETVGRFRGVECPAVVILGAEDMDDVQLFCAYSRATSICIALYDAEELAWKASGRFQQSLLEDAHILAQAQEAKRLSRTATHMAERMGAGIDGVHTTRIAWCSEWSSWLVELSEKGDPGETWIDYLVTSHPWPVFHWYSNGRGEIFLAPPIPGLDQDLEIRWLRIQKCERCGRHVPCEPSSDNCIFCEGKFEEASGAPSGADYRELADFDGRIRRLARGETNESVIADLPVQLAAVGARLYGQQNRQRDTANGAEELPVRNVLYRIAMAFMFARVASMKSGATFDRPVLAEKLYGKYKTLHQVPFERWGRWFAQAIATCMTHKNLLVKVKKNVYSPVDPKQDAKSDRVSEDCDDRS